MSFFVQKEVRGLFMIISNTLIILGRRLMGRRFASDEPSLSFFVIAINLAFFHFLGKYMLFSVVEEYCVVPFYFVR